MSKLKGYFILFFISIIFFNAFSQNDLTFEVPENDFVSTSFNEYKTQACCFHQEQNVVEKPAADSTFQHQRSIGDKGKFMVSVTFGGMFYPNYIKGEPDTKTNVAIANTNSEFGLAIEYFVSPRHRIGIESQFHRLEQAVHANGSSSNIQLSGGSGYVFSVFSYLKFALGDGLYGKVYSSRLDNQISSLETDVLYDYDKARINTLKKIKALEPRPYALLGIGLVSTTLVKVRGTPSDIRQVDYEQKSFALQTGLGFMSRLGTRLTTDLSARYQWCPNYSPSIGGLKSYSGLKLQLNIGFLVR